MDAVTRVTTELLNALPAPGMGLVVERRLRRAKAMAEKPVRVLHENGYGGYSEPYPGTEVVPLRAPTAPHGQ
jgi:hypothetical protein